MSRVAEIRELFEYHRWANGRLLDAVSALPEADFTRDLGSSFPSVRDTLVHLLAAEWAWLSRWRGVSPTGMPEGWASADYEELRDRWREVEAEQRALVDGLDEDALDEVVAYRNTRGRAFESPMWHMLRHVVNHGAYHRGQVVTMLRQLGATPPSTDLIRFYRSGGAGGR